MQPIFEKTEYEFGHGQGRIVKHKYIAGSIEESDKRQFFIGYARVAQVTPQGKRVAEIPFEIPASTLTAAAELFESLAAGAVDAANTAERERVTKPKLIVPGAPQPRA